MPPSQVNQKWDAIVIGTGMGGATLGYALAKAGKSVLFCEKGRSHLNGNEALRGDFAETFFSRHEAPGSKHAEILAQSGRYTQTIEDRSGEKSRRYIPFIGCGTGGSSSLYGMALERFYHQDFTPRRCHPNAEDAAAALPEAWPISYEELRPYYQAAETMFGVRGTLDPLRREQLDPLPDPPAMTGASSELYTSLSGKGLHPYSLPMACERVPDCLGCQGFLCPKDCKKDAASVCLLPAMTQHGAQLLDGCNVLRLEASKGKVTGVVCERNGEVFTLHGGLIVLAAGALASPCILLGSRSSDWPNGLANQSGLVGRFLMRHFVDLYAVYLRTPDGLGSGLKELAFNDFYLDETNKLGTVQSFGVLPPAPVLVAGMEHDLQEAGRGWLVPGLKLVKPFLTRLLSGRLSRSLMLASIMEDLPRLENRVTPAENDNGVVVQYTTHPYDAGRIKLMRQKIEGALRPYRFMLIKQAENNERIAHACGTCRFGDDPKTSVLDRNNKAHGLENLYVVDSSFFPSSGGINPALTIAANALRVVEEIKM